jgi:hypothetical protein
MGNLPNAAAASAELLRIRMRCGDKSVPDDESIMLESIAKSTNSI